jgi:aspartyl/asparaginyl beta-hydroxylase (cupin superfamily)
MFLAKAIALRMLGQLPAAVESLDAALTLDPRNFLALLSKGALMERLGRRRQAAIIYKAAIGVAPPKRLLPPELRAPLAEAHRQVAGYSEALAACLNQSISALRPNYSHEDLGRLEESLEIFAGRARPYNQQPMLFHYPRLPAIPFHDRTSFPWLDKLERASAMITEELERVLAHNFNDFEPYIAYPPGAPVDQWAELNHNRKWSTFFLWRDGVRQEAACALCPRTAALLAEIPLANQPGFAPTVVFSILDARTSIPAHTGSANTRLIGHLPLILPGPARFRVGNVTREWRWGEAWVFDDTIEHEAWNDADRPRAILIFDVWNPLLSAGERALVSAMMVAKKAFDEAP